MSKIQYLPTTLEVVLTCDNMTAKSLTLTRVSDTFEGLRLDGHTIWTFAWWAPLGSDEVLKKLMVTTPNGGRSLYDLLETATPEALGQLGEYDTTATATIETMLKAVKDAEPDQKLEKKRDCLDWIVQYGFYSSALFLYRFDEKCQGCLEEPLLRPLATQILEHLGYVVE